MTLIKRAAVLWPKYAVRTAMVTTAAFLTPLAALVLTLDEILARLEQWEQ
jgi:hypothetical protein